jgi:hypothetical protein
MRRSQRHSSSSLPSNFSKRRWPTSTQANSNRCGLASDTQPGMHGLHAPGGSQGFVRKQYSPCGAKANNRCRLGAYPVHACFARELHDPCTARAVRHLVGGQARGRKGLHLRRVRSALCRNHGRGRRRELMGDIKPRCARKRSDAPVLTNRVPNEPEADGCLGEGGPGLIGM